MRVGGGLAGDRWRRHKEVAAVGYWHFSRCAGARLPGRGQHFELTQRHRLVVDRIGKGIRTAPRDVFISLSATPAKVATAFGVHRALDTAGAMLGPLAAFAVLAVAPLAFDAVFVVSFCVALIGLTILVLFVENSPSEGSVTPDVERVSVRDALGLLASRRFQGLVVSLGRACPFHLISDGFLYLAIQRHFDLD